MPEFEVGQMLRDDGVKKCAVAFSWNCRCLCMPECGETVVMAGDIGGCEKRHVYSELKQIPGNSYHRGKSASDSGKVHLWNLSDYVVLAGVDRARGDERACSTLFSGRHHQP
jgi:hypothetical protein